MPLDNLLADGQPDAGAGILFAGVQALENLENPPGILRLNADAVVPHPKEPLLLLPAGADVDFRRPLAVELDGVSDQVLKELRNLGGIHRQAGQWVAGDLRAGLLDAGLQVVQGVAQKRVQVGRRKDAAPRADAREGQQIGDQPLHALGAVGGAVNILPRLGIQLFRKAVLQQFHITAHRPERLLQIVRGHVGKLFQVLVGPGQFGGALPDQFLEVVAIAGQFGFGPLVFRDVAGGGEHALHLRRLRCGKPWRGRARRSYGLMHAGSSTDSPAPGLRQGPSGSPLPPFAAP